MMQDISTLTQGKDHLFIATVYRLCSMLHIYQGYTSIKHMIPFSLALPSQSVGLVIVHTRSRMLAAVGEDLPALEQPGNALEYLTPERPLWQFYLLRYLEKPVGVEDLGQRFLGALDHSNHSGHVNSLCVYFSFFLCKTKYMYAVYSYFRYTVEPGSKDHPICIKNVPLPSRTI